jgi:hypothetical protein
MLNSDPILPAWLVLPMAVLALLALAGHLLALSAAPDIDPQRRRIRMVNTALMMLTVPLAAYGFGIATPAQSRSYVYVWVLVSALLFMIILLAMLDMLHSWRMHRAQLRELRRQLAAARGSEAQAALSAARRGHERPDDDARR